MLFIIETKLTFNPQAQVIKGTQLNHFIYQIKRLIKISFKDCVRAVLLYISQMISDHYNSSVK